MKGVTLPTETVFVMEASPIKFGLGAMDEIAYDARRLGLKRVLIVTDRHIGELGLPDRVRALLEEEGIITGYSASLNREALGLANEFFVEVSLQAQTEEAFERFEKAVQRVPEILECHLMSGQFDYLLRVVALDASDYERIHRSRISRLPGVQRIQSALALRTIKGWAGYPI